MILTHNCDRSHMWCSRFFAGLTFWDAGLIDRLHIIDLKIRRNGWATTCIYRGIRSSRESPSLGHDESKQKMPRSPRFKWQYGYHFLDSELPTTPSTEATHFSDDDDAFSSLHSPQQLKRKKTSAWLIGFVLSLVIALVGGLLFYYFADISKFVKTANGAKELPISPSQAPSNSRRDREKLTLAPSTLAPVVSWTPRPSTMISTSSSPSQGTPAAILAWLIHFSRTLLHFRLTLVGAALFDSL